MALRLVGRAVRLGVQRRPRRAPRASRLRGRKGSVQEGHLVLLELSCPPGESDAGRRSSEDVPKTTVGAPLRLGVLELEGPSDQENQT